MIFWQRSFMLLLALTLSACSQSSDQTPAPAPEIPQPAPGILSPEDAGPAPAGQSEESPGPVGAVESQVMTWDEAAAFVASQQGKVVVMDLWTTYCAPCRQEFPNLVALHNRLGSQVVCVSVSLNFDGLADEPIEKCQADSMEFLVAQGATFTNIICSTPAEDVFGKQIPHQSVPAVYVFSRSGDLVGNFPNQLADNPDEFSYAKDIVPLVEQLLSVN